MNWVDKPKTALFGLLRRGVVGLRSTGIQRRWPLRQVYPIIFQRLKPTEADVLGHHLYLDARDSLKLSLFGVYEPFETSLLERYVRPGDVVLDIGANIGYYTLLLARLVGPTGTVHAFEPEPSNFALLEKNVRTNGYHNVVLHQAAVGEVSGSTQLFLSETNLGDHQLGGAGNGRRAVEVRQVNIDEVLTAEERPVTFVKLDIQGAETGAIRGMERALRRAGRLTIFTELWPEGLRRCGSDAETYLGLLQSHALTLYEVDEVRGELRPFDPGNRLRTIASAPLGDANLVAHRPGPA